MRGQILNVDNKRRTGLILGDDGNRYSFSSDGWQASRRPMEGMDVDFVLDGSAAREVFPITGRSLDFDRSNDNSVALGWVGIICLALSFVFPVLPTLAAFIVGLIGASSAKRYGNGSGLLLSRIAWVGALLMVLVVVAFIALGLSFAWVMFGDLIDEVRRNGFHHFNYRI